MSIKGIIALLNILKQDIENDASKETLLTTVETISEELKEDKQNEKELLNEDYLLGIKNIAFRLSGIDNLPTPEMQEELIKSSIERLSLLLEDWNK